MSSPHSTSGPSLRRGALDDHVVPRCRPAGDRVRGGGVVTMLQGTSRIDARFEKTWKVGKKNGRISASFEAVLTAADGSVTRLNNTNFWRFREGKFQEVYVYMSGANVLV